MAVTTIKVDTSVRDRLATLAAERGTTIGGLVAELAGKTPTAEERTKTRAETIAYIREHFNPDFSEADVEAARRSLEKLPETPCAL
jgi:hypothetical protein